MGIAANGYHNPTSRPTQRAPDWWESARFQAVCVASGWFRQNGVLSSRPPAGTDYLQCQGLETSLWSPVFLSIFHACTCSRFLFPPWISFLGNASPPPSPSLFAPGLQVLDLVFPSYPL